MYYKIKLEKERKINIEEIKLLEKNQQIYRLEVKFLK